MWFRQFIFKGIARQEPGLRLRFGKTESRNDTKCNRQERVPDGAFQMGLRAHKVFVGQERSASDIFWGLLSSSSVGQFLKGIDGKKYLIVKSR